MIKLKDDDWRRTDDYARPCLEKDFCLLATLFHSLGIVEIAGYLGNRWKNGNGKYPDDGKVERKMVGSTHLRSQPTPPRPPFSS